MPKKLTIEEVKERLYEACGDTVSLDESTYINTHTTCTFIDKEHGEFFSSPHNVLRKKGVHKNRRYEKMANTRTTSVEKIYNQILEVSSGKVKLNISSYSGKYKKCICVDEKYGVWETTPNRVLKGHGHPERGRERIKKTCKKKYGCENPMQCESVKEKIRKTNIEKYGVPNPQQNVEIAMKTAKSCNNAVVLEHWKTKEELVCVGSYEEKTVKWLNENKIYFRWQPKTFHIPELKTTYRPDLYLIGKKKWIEIKGYFRKDAEEKWNWFHKNYPNSELWDKQKLKQLEIL